jgi:hypothetical protein
VPPGDVRHHHVPQPGGVKTGFGNQRSSINISSTGHDRTGPNAKNRIPMAGFAVRQLNTLGVGLLVGARRYA